MKVLHVCPSFYPAFVYGGPIISVYNLCRSLVQNGCDVRVLTTDANGPNDVLDVDTRQEVKLDDRLRVRYCHRIADVSISPRFASLISSYIADADVVHLTSVYSFPTIPTLLLSNLKRKPVVWSPRGMLQRWEGTTRPHLKAAWERLCWTASPRDMVLHVTSEEEGRESQARLPGAKTALVPNGIEITAVARNESPDELRLVFIGRLHPKKGIENLLEAVALLDGSLGKSVSLQIAGDGDPAYADAIAARISELSLASHVKMVGAVIGERKRRLFESADVVVVPSHTENFGLVVAEALAHEVPVIASTGTPWSRLNEIGCGLWIANSAEELASGIKQISQMPLREMGRLGRQWMIQEFSWDLIGRRMMSLYESVLPRP